MTGGKGGNSGNGNAGGQDATVEATVFLQAGAVVPIIVGAQGGTSIYVAGGGGGGLSAVYINGANALPTIVAGLRPYFS